MTFGAPNAAARSIASRYCGHQHGVVLLVVHVLAELAAAVHMVDCRPYFFTWPIGRADQVDAFQAQARRDGANLFHVLPLPKHPRVAPCFKRPLRVTVLGNDGRYEGGRRDTAAEWRNDRRFMVIYRINIAGHK
jgi:hypothetical protein